MVLESPDPPFWCRTWLHGPNKGKSPRVYPLFTPTHPPPPHLAIDVQVFMAVQKAFDVLTDISKRRAYDSSLEFDDSIPGKRNRRPSWALVHQVRSDPAVAWVCE